MYDDNIIREEAVMPRLTKEQLDAVRYVSMDDFIYRINQITDINDKIDFATRYLLDYGHKDKPDVSFYEALYIARFKISDASYDLKEKFDNDDDIDHGYYLGDQSNVVNPYATGESVDMQGRTFMAHPIQYLKAHAMKLAQDIEDKEEKSPEDLANKEYYIQIAMELSHKDEPDKFEEYEKDHTTLELNTRLQERYNGKRALKNAISATKSNFITKYFDSNEYKALVQAEKNYNDPNHEDYRNPDDLETAAAEYLMHKIPNWNPENGYPTEEQINAFSGKAKARVEYAINLAKCLHDVRDKAHHFNQLKYHNRNVKFDVRDAFMPEVQQNKELDQSSFQEELSNDIESENENENVIVNNNNEKDNKELEEELEPNVKK